MTSFESLDSQTRCVARVGNFLQHWALMESGLHDTLGKALGLTDLQTVIVCKNVQLRDKIHILRTALSIIALGTSKRETFDKTLREIDEYSHKRNMFAHDLFMPSEDGESVEFVVVKARGSLKFPKTIWGSQEFSEAFSTIQGYIEQLKVIRQAIADNALAIAIAAAQQRHEPMPWLYGLTSVNPLGPLPQEPHTTGRTTEKKDGETPPAEQK